MPAPFAATNHLLAALPALQPGRQAPRLELIELKAGEILYESGERPQHVYFPLDCVISLLNVMSDGAVTEVGAVGNEGIVGITVFTGGCATPARAVVQCAGHAYRLSAQDIQHEFRTNVSIQLLLLRYAQCLIAQLAQTAACYRHHSLEQQLCRWLLASLDRLPSSEITITQELIANALGVARGGVNQATNRLQRSGIVMHSRGQLRILDRAKLEAFSCECYAVVRREADRFLREADVLADHDSPSVIDP